MPSWIVSNIAALPLLSMARPFENPPPQSNPTRNPGPVQSFLTSVYTAYTSHVPCAICGYFLMEINIPALKRGAFRIILIVVAGIFHVSYDIQYIF